MENNLFSKASKASQVFKNRQLDVNPKEIVEKDGQINFGAFWQALWLTREKDDIRLQLSDLSMSKILSEMSLHKIEFFLPQLLTLMISEEASETEVSAARKLLTFACLHSIHTAVLAHLLLQSLLRQMCDEFSNDGKKKKLVRESLDKSFVVATQCLRGIERTLLFSTAEPAYDLKKRQAQFVEKVEDILEYKEHSFFKAPVYYRKVNKDTKDTPVTKLSLFSKFTTKFLKIKNGYLILHDGESHAIDLAFPLANYLRKTPMKVTKLYDKDNNPPQGPQGTKHFFEITIDKDTILQFQALNETSRKRWIKKLNKEMDNNVNIGNLVTEFEENDARRVKINDIKLNILRQQSIFLNTLEPTEEQDLYSVVTLSKLSTSVLNLESLISHVLQDGSGTIMTFNCEKIGQRLVDYLYDRTQGNSKGSFFTRFTSKRPELLSGAQPKKPEPADDKEKQAPAAQLKMIWFARNSVEPGILQKELIARQWAFLLKDAFRTSPVDKQLVHQVKLKDFTPLILEQNALLPVSNNSFVEEVITDAISLEGLRKRYIREEDEEVTLSEHFTRVHGDKDLAGAQRLFARSLAGCLLLSYVLDIAGAHDQRHILLLADGSLMFSELSGCFSGEKTSFRLTEQMEAMLEESKTIDVYLNCCVKGFLTLRSAPLVELLMDAVKVVSSSAGCGFFDAKECAKLDRLLRSKVNFSASEELSCKKFISFLEKACGTYSMAKKIKQYVITQYLWI